MTWVHLLALAVLVAVVAAVLGMKPKGTKPVARTKLMAAGRVVLFLIAIVIAGMAIASRS